MHPGSGRLGEVNKVMVCLNLFMRQRVEVMAGEAYLEVVDFLDQGVFQLLAFQLAEQTLK